jgi:tRNA threonylcarbamoyl adenosine modification protein YeaZ
MKPNFISIQATYSGASVALFSSSTLLESHTEQDAKASSHLIHHIDLILKKHNLTLQDLDFITIDKGPGAFTSLRVTVATVNGIAFSHRIPLIGIESLDAFVFEIDKKQNFEAIPKTSISIILLNAYNNDVYYAINRETQEATHVVDKGCKKIDAVLELLPSNDSFQTCLITGNGALLHQELITNTLKDRYIVHFHEQAVPSVETIAMLGLEVFNKETKHEYKIEPVYGKSQYFAIRNKAT